MLNSIELKNFKCFAELHIDLAGLNIFSGLNGMGKSTVIQSLLLFKQTQEQGTNLNQFFLNGNYVSLGTGQDVLFENATEEKICLKYTEENVITDVNLEYKATSDVLDVTYPVGEICGSLGADFEYLNAERLSDRKSTRLNSSHWS